MKCKDSILANSSLNKLSVGFTLEKVDTILTLEV